MERKKFKNIKKRRISECFLSNHIITFKFDSQIVGFEKYYSFVVLFRKIYWKGVES